MSANQKYKSKPLSAKIFLLQVHVVSYSNKKKKSENLLRLNKIEKHKNKQNENIR